MKHVPFTGTDSAAHRHATLQPMTPHLRLAERQQAGSGGEPEAPGGLVVHGALCEEQQRHLGRTQCLRGVWMGLSDEQTSVSQCA